MARLIMFSHQAVAEQGLVSGPSQRLVEMAKALKRKGHEVSISEPDAFHEMQAFDGVALLSWGAVKAKEYDAALLQVQCTDADLLEKISSLPVITDVSTPFIVEFIHTLKKSDEKSISYNQDVFYDEQLAPFLHLIEHTDLFLCSSQAQKIYTTGLLHALGQFHPLPERQIAIVQSGIPKEKPKHTKTFFEVNKQIILFPGGMYPWIDAELALKAFMVLSESRDDLALVFLGAENPRVKALSTSAKLLKASAKKLGVLEKSVFFRDWVEYEERQNPYLESTVALITYQPGLETELSFRTRVLDCLWTKLPVVLSSGGEMAELIEHHGLGKVLHENSVEEIVGVLRVLLQDTEERYAIQQRIETFLPSLYWDRTIAPLDAFLKKPSKTSKKKLSIHTLVAEKQHTISLMKERLAEVKSSFDVKVGEERHLHDQIRDKDKVIQNLELELRRLQQLVQDEIRHHQGIIEEIKREKDKEVKRLEEALTEVKRNLVRKEEEALKQHDVVGEEVRKHQLIIEQVKMDKSELQARLEDELRKTRKEVEIRDEEVRKSQAHTEDEVKKHQKIIEEIKVEKRRELEALSAELKQRQKEKERAEADQLKLMEKLEKELEKKQTENERLGKERQLFQEKIETETRRREEDVRKLSSQVGDEVRKHQGIIERLEKEKQLLQEKYDGEIRRKDDELRLLSLQIGEEVRKHQAIILHKDDALRSQAEKFERELAKKDHEVEKAQEKTGKEVEKHQGYLEDLKKEKTEVQKRLEEELRGKVRLLEKKEDEIATLHLKVGEEVKKHQAIIFERDDEIKKLKEHHEREVKKREDYIQTLKKEIEDQAKRHGAFQGELTHEKALLEKQMQNLLSLQQESERKEDEFFRMHAELSREQSLSLELIGKLRKEKEESELSLKQMAATLKAQEIQIAQLDREQQGEYERRLVELEERYSTKIHDLLKEKEEILSKERASIEQLRQQLLTSYEQENEISQELERLRHECLSVQAYVSQQHAENMSRQQLLTDVIRKRDEVLQQREKQFQELHQKLVALQHTMNEQMKKKDDHIEYLKHRLKDILSSTPYKLFNAYHGLRRELGLVKDRQYRSKYY